MGSLRRLNIGFLFTVVMMVIVLLASPAILMRVMMASYIYTDPTEIPHVTAALVPGASVVRGRPSPILEERTRAAQVLYAEKKVDVILVTGAVEGKYDEVTPMKHFLTDEGVPAGDIAADSAGVDTFTSMYRAKNVFLADSFVIVTQDFHLPRAVFLARALHINAYGLAVSRAGTLYDYLREIPASWKAIWDVIAHSAPQKQIQLAPIMISDVSAG